MTTIQIRTLANGRYQMRLAGTEREDGILATQIPTLDEARRRARVWRDLCGYPIRVRR